MSVIGNAASASTRVLRLVNSEVSCVAPGCRRFAGAGWSGTRAGHLPTADVVRTGIRPRHPVRQPFRWAGLLFTWAYQPPQARPRINATPARRDLLSAPSPPVNSGGGGSEANGPLLGGCGGTAGIGGQPSSGSVSPAAESGCARVGGVRGGRPADAGGGAGTQPGPAPPGPKRRDPPGPSGILSILGSPRKFLFETLCASSELNGSDQQQLLPRVR